MQVAKVQERASYIRIQTESQREKIEATAGNYVSNKLITFGATTPSAEEMTTVTGSVPMRVMSLLWL